MRFFPSFFPLVAAVKGQSHYGWWMFSSSELRRRSNLGSDFWAAHFAIKYISCLSLPPLPPPLWKLTGIAFVAWVVFNFGFYVYFYLCMCISHHSHLQLISSCLFLRTLDVSIDSIRRAIRNVIQLQAIAVASGGRWDEFRKKYK